MLLMFLGFVALLSSCGLRCVDCLPSFTQFPNSGNTTYVVEGAGSVTLAWDYNSDGFSLLHVDLLYVKPGPRTVVVARKAPGQNLIVYSSSGYTGRISFSDRATFQISSIVQSDSRIFQCRLSFSNSDPPEYQQNAVVVVVVPPSIQLRNQSSVEVKEGDPFTLLCVASGNPKPSYTWTKDSVTVQQTSNANYTITSANKDHAGTYTCTARVTVPTVNTNPASYTVTVRVKYKPQVTALYPNQTASNDGSNALFTCEAVAYPTSIEYLWFKDGSQITSDPNGDYFIQPLGSGSRLRVNQIKKNSAGRYSCSGRNSEGTGIQAFVYFKVNYAPENVTVTSTNPQGVKEGQSATLTCYADGYPLPSFSWKFNGNPVTGAQQKTLVLTNARVDDAGNYTCVARNFRGSKEFTREVHVRYKPTVTTFTTGTPGNSAVKGRTVTLTCSADGYPDPQYTIGRNNVSLVLNNKFVINNIQLVAEDDTYSCVPQNAEGTGPTAVLKITVQVPPKFPGQSLPSTKQTKKENETQSYSCTAQAKPVAEIVWVLNGKNLTDTPPYNISESFNPIQNSKLSKTLSYLTISPLSWRQNGSYSCVAYNPAGQKQQSTVLEVQYRPVVQSRADHPKNLTLAEGQRAEFTCKTIGNPETLSHRWRFNGVDIPGSGFGGCISTTYTKAGVTQLDAGWYSCIGTNIDGDGPPASAQLLIKHCLPSFTQSPNSGNPTYVAEGARSVTLAWDYNSNGFSLLHVDLHVVLPGPQTVIVARKAPGQNLIVYSSSGYTGRISFRDRATFQISNIVQSDSRIFQCRLSFSNSDPPEYQQNAEVVVVVPPSIQLRSQSLVEVKEGNPFTLLCVASGNPKPSYTWTKDSATVQQTSNSNYTITSANKDHAGTYTCTARVTAPTVNTHPASYTVTVRVKFKPQVTALYPNQTALNDGSNAFFTCEAVAYPTSIEYLWFKDGSQITSDPNGDYFIQPSGSGSRLRVNQIKKNSAGRYSCSGRNSEGIGTQAFVYFKVNYAPENVTVTSTNPQGVKEGQSATLTCYADGYPLPSFSWKFNGNPVTGAQQKTLVLTNARADNAGNYTCVARNFRGSKEFTKEVHVRYKPTVTTFTTGTPGNSAVQGRTVTLTCSGADGYPDPQYTIRRNNVSLVLNNPGKFVINNIQLVAEDDTYSCVPQNAEGTGPTAVLKIIVQVPPDFPGQSLPSTKQTKRENETQSYSCTAQAKPVAEIIWVLNGKNLTHTPPYNISTSFNPIQNSKLSETLSYLTIRPLSWRQNGSYSCVAYNPAGQKQQSTLLEVQYRPVVQSDADHPKNLTLAEGETATFTCKTIGNPETSSHRWQFSGVDIPGSGCGGCISTTYTKAGVTHLDAGWYSCIGTNIDGDGPPASAQLLIERPPRITRFPQDSYTVNETNNVTMVCGGDGVPVPDIIWVKTSSDKEVGRGEHFTIVNTSGSDDGTYRCTARNELGSDSKEVTLNVQNSAVPPDRGTVRAIRSSDEPTVIVVTWTVSDEQVTKLSLDMQEGGNSVAKKGVTEWTPVPGAQDMSIDKTEFKLENLKSDKQYTFRMDMRRPGEKDLASCPACYVYSNTVAATESIDVFTKISEKDGLSAAEVSGIVVGIILLIVVVILFYILWIKRRGNIGRKRLSERKDQDLVTYVNDAVEIPFGNSANPKTVPERSKDNAEPVYSEISEAKGEEVPVYMAARAGVSREYQMLDRTTMDWEIAPHQVSILNTICKGAFGQVARATVMDVQGMHESRTVAVKMLKANASESDRDSLKSELEIMKKLKPHSHIIKLLGCVTKSGPLMVLIEYVPYGDLHGFLNKNRGLNDSFYNNPEVKLQSTLTSQQLIKFAWEIADGMDFLSSNNIIHRDLAARNVLLGENKTCKVANFGMAKENDYERETGGRLPVKWTAYEALVLGHYTPKSDVWSYGVVLYEIFIMGDCPYPNMNGHEVVAFLKDGKRMVKPKHLSEDLYLAMQECWKEEPQERPTFHLLKTIMEKMQNAHIELFSWGPENDESVYQDIDT